jgi:triphosphoribosyl-dephospho-CoA synthetase
MQLIRFGRFVSRGDFAGLYAAVGRSQTNTLSSSSQTREVVSRAIDIACAWYWRRLSCLEHSAATTCLLRRYGTPAELVIATQHRPFKAHAWVEVDGQVVNDSRDVRALYAVLDKL